MTQPGLTWPLTSMRPWHLFGQISSLFIPKLKFWHTDRWANLCENDVFFFTCPMANFSSSNPKVLSYRQIGCTDNAMLRGKPYCKTSILILTKKREQIKLCLKHLELGCRLDLVWWSKEVVTGYSFLWHMTYDN